MKTALKKAWNWFNGKKSTISIIGLGVCGLGIMRNNVNPDVLEAMTLGFTIIGGVGVIHRDIKSDKSVIKKVQSNINKSLNRN